jgi:hypothetical protein
VNSSFSASATSNRIPTTLRFRNYIWEHVKKLAHFQSVLQHVRLHSRYLQALNDKQPSQPSKESRRLHDLTNVIRAVYTLGLSNTKPFAFPRLIDLLRLSGANMGSRNENEYPLDSHEVLRRRNASEHAKLSSTFQLSRYDCDYVS